MISFADQWRVISKARKEVPVDVEGLPEKMGIQFRKAFLPREISGMLERWEDTFLITVAANDPHTRQRFTLAHELGHYMLHRKLIGAGLDDDRAYRSTEAGKYHNTLIGPREETEANRFAANLLMPVELIAREWNARNRVISQNVVEEMATLFKVSKKSMEIRLENSIIQVFKIGRNLKKPT